MKTELPKLSAPAQRALAQAGIEYLEQLTEVSEAEVKKWHGVGPGALKSLKAALEAKVLAFAPK